MKVKFNSKQYTDGLIKSFKKFTKDTKELDKAATTIVREIKADSRDGKGYDGKDFPNYTNDKTVPRRTALGAVNRTSRFFSPGKNNATFMGDTINKITHKVKKGIIELFGQGNHRIIKGVRGKSLKGSNAPIASILEGLSDLGYKILGVSKNSNKKIAIQFKRWLRRNL